MNEDATEIHQYLVPSDDSFWKWEESGEVIVWTDGTTILFRQELIEILAHLAPQGLPPFEILLMLMTAMRDSSEKIEILEDRVKAFHQLWSIIDSGKSKSVQSKRSHILQSSLEKAQQLPKDLRTTPEGKALIAEVVFEFCSNRTTPEIAQAVVNHLSTGVDEIIFQPIEESDFRTNTADLTFKDITDFDKGLAQLDPQELRLRQSTGLDTLPQPVKLEISFAEQIRQFISELKNEEEHRSLAKLAQNLLAAVSLPKPVSEPEDIAHGGVSDICNRGPLDRLLLSELANDDLTLTVRVAVNEAMYLRREASPLPPNRCRILLIDCGIRSWGIPRVYLTAVAMALAATVDPIAEFQAFRAVQNGIEPVELASREGLEELLQSLDTNLHPGSVLPEYVKQLKQLDFAPEPVLIITEDAWKDPELQHAIQESNIEIMHVATVKRDGQFQLLERNSRGIKTLCELQMDLEEIFSGSRKSVSTIIKNEGLEELPAVFSVHPFLLRLAIDLHQGKQITWWVPDYGQLGVTDNGLLLYWSQSRFGAKLLACNIPNLKRGYVRWKSGIPKEGRVSLVSGHLYNSNFQIVHIDLEKQEVSHTPVEVKQMKSTAICAHNGFLFIINEEFQTIISVDLVTGERVGSCHYPSNLNLVCDRFFRNHEDSQWFALSHDMTKGQPALTEFPLGKVSPSDVVTIFERNPDVGPVCVLKKNGTFYFPAREEIKIIPYLDSTNVVSLSPAHISTNGTVVVLKFVRSYDSGYCFINTLSFQADLCKDLQAINHTIDQPEHWKKTVVNIRKKFLGILITDDGKLVLKTNKQFYLRLDYNQNRKKIELAYHTFSALVQKKFKTFKKVKTDQDIGCRLSVATWDDGSQAFLDSRGMLHLKSPDHTIPEVSLVLAQNEISGWCSDSRFWGSSYFCGKHDVCDPEEIFNSVIQKLVESIS